MWVGGEPTVLLPTHDRRPSRPPSDLVWDFSGETMGTTWSVRLVPDPAHDPDAYRAAIEAELATQVALFSHWEPTSELSRFNVAPPGPVGVSALFLNLVARCLDFAEATDGAVDPTLGALVDLWGFGPPGPRPKGDRPTQAEIDQALATSGWRRLIADRKASTLLQPGGLRLDLSGLAKGHAVDAISARLTAMGATHHLVEIGGELVGRGVRPDAQPWWVALEGPHATLTRVALFDLAVATSGDAYRAVEIDGRRHGHTLDGRTGRPLDNGVASVTVFADTAFEADAWATALSVMGAETGLATADHFDLSACLMTQNGAARFSGRWTRMAAVGD